MSDGVTVVLVLIGINAVLIWLFFGFIGCKFIAKPRRQLCAGLLFMGLAVGERTVLNLIKPGIIMLVDIEPAINFVEISIAALGANLVASAFMSKARMLHVNWKDSMLNSLERTAERMAELERDLDRCNTAQLQMSATDFESWRNAIFEKMNQLETSAIKTKESLDAVSRF